MPVESPVNTIADLNQTYPVHTDGLAQADSHIRLIKTALQLTFPNVKGVVSISNTDMANGFTPIGGIILFNGAVTSIPTNWHLCDGTNGTVDLRDKFVIGAGNNYAVGATGGATSFTGTTNTDGSHTHQSTATSTSASVSGSVSTATPSGTASATSSADTQGSHTHPGSTDNALALTAAQIPPHSHSISCGNTINGSDPGIVYLQTLVPGDSFNTDMGNGLLGQTHQHGLTMVADGSHTHNVSTSVSLSLSTSVSTTTSTTTTTTTSVTTPASSDSSHAHGFGVSNVLPPYYALAYIQRIS